MSVPGKGGQPLKYPTPESLQVVIDKYFKSTPFEEYTVTGLALVVGSKQLVQDYEKREKYTEVIHIAKLRIEHSYEMSLRKNGGANNIFALKNFGWTDKQEIGFDEETLDKIIRLPSKKTVGAAINGTIGKA